MVITGVSVVLWVTVLSGITAVPRDSQIQSVTVTSDRLVRVKPFQPAFFVLDIIVDQPLNNRRVRSVPSELVAKVVVNGRTYTSVLSDVNAVAGFMIDKSSITTAPDGRTSLRVVAMMQWNAEEGGFLFGDPGMFEIQFSPQGRVNVVVEEPTDAEEALLAEIEEAGLKRELLLTGLNGIRNDATVTRVEQMLAKYPDTAYTGLLSIALGFQKLKEIRGGPGVDPREFVRSRERVARKYLEPYCRGEIKSLLQSAAAFTLAEEVLQRLRVERDMPKAEAEALRRSATQLLDKVKASPYALEFRSKADRKLRELTRSLPK